MKSTKFDIPENLEDLKSPGRRDFFTKIALASVACYLPTSLISCKDDGAIFTGTGKAPFKVWEEMLEVVMTSPDYLPGRMERLIASKDLSAMYHFVKDEITLIPTTRKGLSGMGTKFKWGLAGVLRCGMATPREKAELLNYMYAEAGITSKVVFERTSIKKEEVPAIFFRPTKTEFSPTISKKQLKNWKKEMGLSVEKNLKISSVVDFREEAKQISDQIFRALTIDESQATSFDYRWDNYRTPSVVFTEAGVEKYAHLFDPNTPFGQLRNPENKFKDADPVSLNEEEISISIKCRESVNPKEDIELISGTWSAQDLVGKQILLQFLHGLSTEEQMVTNINQLRTFIPALALQGAGIDRTFLEDRSFLGNPFTLEGKKIFLDAEETKPSHSSQFLAKSNPDLQKSVETISVEAVAANFPKVQLSVDARDVNGQMIEGLSAADFTITEDGRPIRAIMENNQRTPKILVLSDSSMSMPTEYYGKGMEVFNDQLKANVLANFPAAKLEFWKTPSSLFTWLLKASRTEFDLIVYATDGDNNDSYNEDNLSIYQSGPPALILNVKGSESKYRQNTFLKMAEVTGGKVLPAKNQEEVLVEIANYLDAIDPAPYVFSFGSAEKDKKHKVEVRIDKGRVLGEANYQFPQTQNTETNGIIGVYMDVKVGKARAVRRVLAGWDPVYKFVSSKNEQFNNESKQLFIGGAVLSIEGEGPTKAMALRDLLSAKLSNRTWGEAFIDNKVMEAKELTAEGTNVFPSELLCLMAPLQDQVTADSLTFPSGYRIGMVKTVIGIDKGQTSISFDYLPTSDYSTMTSNGVKAVKTTIEKTAQLAARESMLYAESTWSHLKELKVISHSPPKSKWLESVGVGYKDENYPFWREKILRGGFYYKITDEKAVVKSYWQINKKTGELYGMLPDGSGGGSSSGDPVEGITNLINLMMAIKDIMLHLAAMYGIGIINPIGAVAISVVAKYGVTLVKLYAIVSESIMIMDTSGMDEKVAKELQILACNVAKEIGFGFGGNPGGVMAGLDNLIGMMVPNDDNPFACK